MLCCLAVQLQVFGIGVTTNSPDTGPLPQGLSDVHRSDQYWYVDFRSVDCRAWIVFTLIGDCGARHKGQSRVLQCDLDDSAGNTFGCDVSDTGELHLYHNGRDVGVVWEGLPTDQPMWGFVILHSGWKVEANYIIPKGEAACGVSLCCLLSTDTWERVRL